MTLMWMLGDDIVSVSCVFLFFVSFFRFGTGRVVQKPGTCCCYCAKRSFRFEWKSGSSVWLRQVRWLCSSLFLALQYYSSTVEGRGVF